MKDLFAIRHLGRAVEDGGTCLQGADCGKEVVVLGQRRLRILYERHGKWPYVVHFGKWTKTDELYYVAPDGSFGHAREKEFI